LKSHKWNPIFRAYLSNCGTSLISKCYFCILQRELDVVSTKPSIKPLLHFYLSFVVRRSNKRNHHLHIKLALPLKFFFLKSKYIVLLYQIRIEDAKKMLSMKILSQEYRRMLYILFCAFYMAFSDGSHSMKTA